MNKVYLSGEKYRLELHWSDTEYIEGECLFKGAYFTGPVLQIAERIEENSSMMLDFYKQYYVIVDNVYIGKLVWNQVTYVDNKILLDGCKLTHKSELNKVPKLTASDMLVIDCSHHERQTHDFYTTYKTYVSNGDTQVYTF